MVILLMQLLAHLRLDFLSPCACLSLRAPLVLALYLHEWTELHCIGVRVYSAHHLNPVLWTYWFVDLRALLVSMCGACSGLVPLDFHRCIAIARERHTDQRSATERMQMHLWQLCSDTS